MSQQTDGEIDFHPLNVIQPEKWNNIPQCLMDGFRLMISEVKSYELKIKFVQDKLLETQKRMEKQLKSVEKMIASVETSLLENINQQKEATQKSIKSLAFEVSLVSERSSENQHDLIVLQRKVDELERNLTQNYKLKNEYNDEYKRLKEDTALHIEISQQQLKEHITLKFAESFDIPGLVGPGRKYLEAKALVKDLYYSYDSKAALLNEISENRDEYFKGVCGKYVEEMNLPIKIKTLLRNDMKPEILKETLAKVEERVKQSNEEINANLNQGISQIREEARKRTGVQEERIKNLEQKFKDSNSRIEKTLSNVSHETENKINNLQKKTRSRLDEISSKLELLTHGSDLSQERSQGRSPQRSQGPSPERQERQSGFLKQAIKDSSKEIMNLKSSHHSSKIESDDQSPEQRLVVPEMGDEKRSSHSIKRQSTMSRKETESIKPESVSVKKENSDPNTKTASELLKEPPGPSQFQSSKNSLSSRKAGSSLEKSEKEEPIKIENQDEVSFRQDSLRSRNKAESESSADNMEHVEYPDAEEDHEDERDDNNDLDDEDDDNQNLDYHENLENSMDQVNHSQEQLNFSTAGKRRENSFIYRRPMMDPNGSLDMSSKTSFLQPIKVNAEAQTAGDSILSAINGFDITKMEPYTLEFLKVLEGELSNIRSSIRETKDDKNVELNLHLNYHYYNDKNTDFHKDYYEKNFAKEATPQTFDNVLSELKTEANEKKNRPKSSGIHSKVKLSPMLLLRMIARRRTLGNKIKQINELSMEAKASNDPLISVKSHSFDKRNSPSRSPEHLAMNQTTIGINTIREAHESYEQDEKVVLRGNHNSSHVLYPSSKKNKSEDTSDLGHYEEKKPNSPEFTPHITLPSILKKPLIAKKAEITFDIKSKEDSILKPNKPRSIDKRPTSQTESRKRTEVGIGISNLSIL